MYLKTTLPWPPSANKYWRYWRGRFVVNTDAREYKKEIRRLSYTWIPRRLNGHLSIAIEAHPPDRRKRDLDNLLKITIDSLEFTGLFDDDSQIDKIIIKRGTLVKNGELKVKVSTRD